MDVPRQDVGALSLEEKRLKQSAALLARIEVAGSLYPGQDRTVCKGSPYRVLVRGHQLPCGRHVFRRGFREYSVQDRQVTTTTSEGVRFWGGRFRLLRRAATGGGGCGERNTLA